MQSMGSVAMATSFIPVIILLVQFLFFGLGVYFLITAIQFMKRKLELDKELVKKMDMIIDFNQRKDFQD